MSLQFRQQNRQLPTVFYTYFYCLSSDKKKKLMKTFMLYSYSHIFLYNHISLCFVYFLQLITYDYLNCTWFKFYLLSFLIPKTLLIWTNLLKTINSIQMVYYLWFSTRRRKIYTDIFCTIWESCSIFLFKNRKNILKVIFFLRYKVNINIFWVYVILQSNVLHLCNILT